MIDLTAFKDSLNGKPVALFGLGVSGIATLEALIKNDITVFAYDDHDTMHQKAVDMGAKLTPLNVSNLEGCACLILAPGVPLTHPEPHNVVKAAHAAGIEIIGDIEILHRTRHGHKTIGITGTNGKSTTTALLTHVLNACGKNAMMGGNIGVPVLKLNPSQKDTIFILEMSSYQIDLCPTFYPDIGVLLNITPDHIDRHGSFENYAAIKHRMMKGTKHQIYAEQLDETRLTGHKFPMLPGDHNQQNILSVLAVCDLLSIDQDKAIKAVKTFPGLAHRQYLVRSIGNVQYINDSKATNAEAASKALASHENIFWIVGGQSKEGGLAGLEYYVSKIEHAYLIGEASEEFQHWMDEHQIPATQCKTLDKATKAAHAAAQNQKTPATVLLSPACASWDQFKSFEHRGNAFIKIVEGL